MIRICLQWRRPGFDPLEKEMATHSGVLAWRIPWTGGAWWATMRLQRVDTTAQVSLSHKSLIQDSPSGSLFTFGQLSCLFPHTWLVLRPFPWYMHNFLLRWIPLQRPMGVCPHLLWGGTPALLILWRAFLCTGKSSWPQEWSSYLFTLANLSFYHKANLRSVLDVSGWEQNFSFTPLGKHQLSSPAAHLSPTSVWLQGERWSLWLYLSFPSLCLLNFPGCLLDAVVRGPGLQWQGWEVAMIHKQKTVTIFLTLCQNF